MNEKTEKKIKAWKMPKRFIYKEIQREDISGQIWYMCDQEENEIEFEECDENNKGINICYKIINRIPKDIWLEIDYFEDDMYTDFQEHETHGSFPKNGGCCSISFVPITPIEEKDEPYDFYINYFGTIDPIAKDIKEAKQTVSRLWSFYFKKAKKHLLDRLENERASKAYMRIKNIYTYKQFVTIMRTKKWEIKHENESWDDYYNRIIKITKQKYPELF